MGRNVTRHDPDSHNLTDWQSGELRFLILHNDSINTFEFVIRSLIDVCDHDPVQAEQCAWITHHKGKCDVRKGTYDSLNPLRQELLTRGLQVTID